MGYILPPKVEKEANRRKKDPVYSLLPINITVEFLNPNGKKVYAKTNLEDTKLGLKVLEKCCKEVMDFAKVPIEPQSVGEDLANYLDSD